MYSFKPRELIHAEAQAIEDTMDLLWGNFDDRVVSRFIIDRNVKKKYTMRAKYSCDTIDIDRTDGVVVAFNRSGDIIEGEFIVDYYPTGSKYLFENWIDAYNMVKMRIKRIDYFNKIWI